MKAMHALVVLSALAAAPALLAQDAHAVDAFAYGPAPANLHGQAGGARWTAGWMGVSAQHLSGIGSYWMFENNSLDSGPLQSHGTDVNATYSTDVPAAIVGWSSSSLSLAAASSAYIDLDAHVGKYADLNHGSFAAWIKTTATSARTIIGASDSTEQSKEIALSLSNGRPWYDVRGDLNSWSQNSVATTIHDGTWHHLCVSVEGNGIATLYVDGVAVDTRHQGFFRYVFDLNHMAIGRNLDSNHPTGEWYFDGLIDDLAVWGSPLSAAEVQSLAAGTIPPIAIPGMVVAPGPNVEVGSLVHTGAVANGLFPSENRLVSTGMARAGRMFPDLWHLGQNRSYYLSCIVRREDTNSTIEPATLELTDAGTTRGNIGWDAMGNWLLGGLSAAPIVGAEVMQPNTDYFVVLRIDASTTNLADKSYMKVFGPGATVPLDDSAFSTTGTGPTQWTAETTGFTSGAVMDTIWLTPTGSNKIEIDELRMGGSWSSVARGTFGSGCLGMQSSVLGRPALGSNVALQLSGGAPTSLAAAMVGLSRTTSSFGALPFDVSTLGGVAGCYLLQSYDAVLFAFADGGGYASTAIGLPSGSAFYGLNLYAQWASIDPAIGGPFPARFSDAVQLLIQD